VRRFFISSIPKTRKLCNIPDLFLEDGKNRLHLNFAGGPSDGIKNALSEMRWLLIFLIQNHKRGDWILNRSQKNLAMLFPGFSVFRVTGPLFQYSNSRMNDTPLKSVQVLPNMFFSYPTFPIFK